MDLLQNESIFDLKVNEEAKTHLAGIAQWANINALIGFSSMAIAIITLFATIGKGELPGVAIVLTSILSVVLVVISLILNLALLNAGKNIKMAVDSGDQSFFSVGISKLASYFKIIGILFVIGLICFGLFFILGILVGSFANNFLTSWFVSVIIFIPS